MDAVIALTRSSRGVAAVAERSLAGMSAAQRQAHARLASLPRRVHLQERRDLSAERAATALRVAEVRRLRATVTSGESISLPRSRRTK